MVRETLNFWSYHLQSLQILQYFSYLTYHFFENFLGGQNGFVVLTAINAGKVVLPFNAKINITNPPLEVKIFFMDVTLAVQVGTVVTDSAFC